MSLLSEDCQTLIKTYNASILKKLPGPLTESLLTAAKDCLEQNKVETETGKKRTVLATLISNLVDNEKVIETIPDVGFMDGPLNISLHWSKTFKKLIYIFGEIHEGKRCPTQYVESTRKIEDYLVEWFRKPTAYTDFYLEIGGFEISDGYGQFSGQETLDVLRERFRVCIDKKTRDRQLCDLSRMHFFDIREKNIKGVRPVITRFYHSLCHLLLDLDSEGGRRIVIKLLNTFWDDNSYYIDTLSNITEYSDKKYKEFWYDQLYNFQIIKKEIDNMNENVRPYLNWFIKNELDKDIIKNMIEIKDILRKIYTQKGTIWSPTTTTDIISTFIKNLIKFKELAKNIDSLFVDAYLLARIFKTFKINDPDPNKRRLVDEPLEPHNIIIYAGSGHSARYREFLNTLPFKTLEKSGEGFNGNYEGLTYVKCINMKEKNKDGINIITLPLFNTWPSEDDKAFVSFDQATLEKYESFEKTFNIKSDGTMSESDGTMSESDDTMSESDSEESKTMPKKRVVSGSKNKDRLKLKGTIGKNRR
jgi:hypothetical protein